MVTVRLEATDGILRVNQAIAHNLGITPPTILELGRLEKIRVGRVKTLAATFPDSGLEEDGLVVDGRIQAPGGVDDGLEPGTHASGHVSYVLRLDLATEAGQGGGGGSLAAAAPLATARSSRGGGLLCMGGGDLGHLLGGLVEDVSSHAAFCHDEVLPLGPRGPDARTSDRVGVDGGPAEVDQSAGVGV